MCYIFFNCSFILTSLPAFRLISIPLFCLPTIRKKCLPIKESETILITLPRFWAMSSTSDWVPILMESRLLLMEWKTFQRFTLSLKTLFPEDILRKTSERLPEPIFSGSGVSNPQIIEFLIYKCNETFLLYSKTSMLH